VKENPGQQSGRPGLPHKGLSDGSDAENGGRVGLPNGEGLTRSPPCRGRSIEILAEG
jgi:hypothetical protein